MKIGSKEILIGLILFCLSLQTVSAVTYEFSGMSTGYSGTNIIYVNVTESKIPGLIGETEVLLPQPVRSDTLNHLIGEMLDFDYVGHDLTGKPIADAYFNNIRLEEIPTYYWNPGYPGGYYSQKAAGYYSQKAAGIHNNTSTLNNTSLN